VRRTFLSTPWRHWKTKTLLLLFQAINSCILGVNFSFLFQLDVYYMLNTYIYHILPPTLFGACYTIFRETTALVAPEQYAFCNLCNNILEQVMQLSPWRWRNKQIRYKIWIKNYFNTFSKNKIEISCLRSEKKHENSTSCS